MCRVSVSSIESNFRSSRPEVSCKIGGLRNFAKFTEKRLCQSLFFNKVTGLRPATLLKKRFWHRYFPVNFAKISKNPFFYRTPPVAASEICSLSCKGPIPVLRSYPAGKIYLNKISRSYFVFVFLIVFSFF